MQHCATTARTDIVQRVTDDFLNTPTKHTYQGRGRITLLGRRGGGVGVGGDRGRGGGSGGDGTPVLQGRHRTLSQTKYTYQEMLLLDGGCGCGCGCASGRDGYSDPSYTAGTPHPARYYAL